MTKMTPAQVRRRLKTIQKHQNKWKLAEKELQDSCPHGNVDEKYKGNSGNYDSSANSYWIEYCCLDCGKFWTEEQQ